MSHPIDYNDRPWLDPEAEPFIKVQSVSKHFGDFTAVDSVDLDIYKGELFCLLGGSGCGKTTLLRMLAGFETPSSGSILIDGVNATVAHQERLVRLLGRKHLNVNLIPMNPVEGLPFRPPPHRDVEAFRKRLEAAGIPTHIRRPRGREIDAACGQLRLRKLTQRSQREHRPQRRQDG